MTGRINEPLQNVFTHEERSSLIIHYERIDPGHKETPPGIRALADASGTSPEYSFLDEIFESFPQCILILEEGVISRGNLPGRSATRVHTCLT